MAELLIVKQTAMLTHKGRPVRLRQGTVVYADDPIVKGRESLFKPLEVAYLGGSPVETATAAPGEKRSIPEPDAERRCDQCDYVADTERGLSIHKGRAHKEEDE